MIVLADFKEDFFELLNEDRPDHRWLIIGPTRSGSSFHIDPNSTCAWNAVLSGAKKWILFPPDGPPPPGVYPSEEGSHVSTPVSIIEWFMNFYDQIFDDRHESQRPMEGVVRAGETIFVPQGWWHLVLNLEESIAITQNYVPRCNLVKVLRFLRDKPDQVSGCSKENRALLYGKLMAHLQRADPSLAQTLQHQLAHDSTRHTSVVQEERPQETFAFNFQF